MGRINKENDIILTDGMPRTGKKLLEEMFANKPDLRGEYDKWKEQKSKERKKHNS